MKPAPHLSLVQHFTAAALSLGMGMAAAMAVDTTIVTALNAVYQTPLTAFAVNFGTLFAVTGGAAGYLSQSFAQYNAARPLQSWALPAQPWWIKNEGPG